jgi:hypothetical protein
MSQPFSGLPDPGIPSRLRRRFQPGPLREALRSAMRDARRYGQNLWHRGKRNPRTFALVGGAVALTLAGAYALSASGTEQSLCASATKAISSASKAQKGRKTPPFLLLMDRVPHAAVGSELEIHYDVCGLPSGTPYRGRVRLSLQQAGKKKKRSAKPTPLVITFQDEVDGVASRRHQPVDLGSTKPGAYTLELSVVDNQGRERKRLQKLLVKAK